MGVSMNSWFLVTGRIFFKKNVFLIHLSGTRIQPKEEVFGRISLRTSGQKLRSGPPNPGKTSISERTSRADVLEKTSV